MTSTPVYSLGECMDLMKDCRLEELVALSTLLTEEWSRYSLEEQAQLLPALTKRRKELHRTADREWLFFRNRNFPNNKKD